MRPWKADANSKSDSCGREDFTLAADLLVKADVGLVAMGVWKLFLPVCIQTL